MINCNLSFLYTAIILASLVPYASADDINFKSIEIDYVSLYSETRSTSISTGKPEVRRFNSKDKHYFSRVNAEGKTFYTFDISGMNGGCRLDGRYTIVTPFYLIGRSHSDSFRCTWTGSPKDSGAIKYNTKSSFEGGILSISGTLRTNFRTKYGSGETGGFDSVGTLDMKVDLNGGKCRVLNVKVAQQQKSFPSGKISGVTATTGFSTKCRVRR